jgi:hypothetical protein
VNPFDALNKLKKRIEEMGDDHRLETHNVAFYPEDGQDIVYVTFEINSETLKTDEDLEAEEFDAIFDSIVESEKDIDDGVEYLTTQEKINRILNKGDEEDGS